MGRENGDLRWLRTEERRNEKKLIVIFRRNREE
jgi:hypothetical protein